MGNTKLISMRIDAELHKKARELGLNITKVCENALRQAVAKLEAPNTQTNGGTAFLSEGSFGKESSIMVLRPGFEPGSAAFFHNQSREAVIHGSFHV